MEERIESLESEVSDLQIEIENLVQTHNKYYNALKEIACGSETWTREQMIDLATETIMGGGLL